MSYTPSKVVTINKGKLIESEDLTKPVSAFIQKDAYLILEKDRTPFTISINKPLLFETSINQNSPVGTAFNSLLNDSFVTKYGVSGIPLLNIYNTYDKRLRVLDPIAYKKHTVGFTSIDTPHIVNDMTKRGYLDDLVIDSREDMSHYLVAVDGVFHRTAIHQGKVYVLDGFRTMRLSGRKDMTVVDTKEIGGHSIINLTTQNTTLNTYNGTALIKTNQSLKNKTVFLVIDGYFYHMDTDVFFMADDSSIKVRTNKLNLISQFRHNPRTVRKRDLLSQEASQQSRKYEDPYATVFLDNRHVPTSTFTTKEFQLSRLTTYHSFLVVMNHSNIFQVTSELIPTGTPQFYQDPTDRVLSGMMSYGVGLCPSHLILKDPYQRKTVYLGKFMDNDLDWQKESITPKFIPNIVPDVDNASRIPARFVDYVSV